MLQRKWGIIGLLALATLALWLLLAGPPELLGIDTGQAGTALLVTAAWVSMFFVSRLPRPDLDRFAAPAEWKAWTGAVFMLVAISYFLAKAHVFMDGAGLGDPDAARVGRHLVMLLVAWTILSSVLASRWNGEVEEDERDREIAASGVAWGRGALVAIVIGIALLLGVSPAHKLRWASHFMVANLLVMALMWACLAEYIVVAVQYWQGRRR